VDNTVGDVLGFLGLLVLFALGALLSFAFFNPHPEAVASQSLQTRWITIYNPWRYNIQMELKCNYNSSKKRFARHEFIELRGNSRAVVSLGKKDTRCEIWPKLL